MFRDAFTGLGVLAACIVALWVILEIAQWAWVELHYRRRDREWRRSSRRSSSAAPIAPLSTVLRRPRLGERCWLAHDASDPTKGGVPCEVVLVDRAGVVYREVPLVRLSRMPE